MINRRDFTRLTTAAVALSGSSLFAHQTALPSSIIRPKKLSEGDTVGLVLPASMAFEPDEIHMAREQLEAMGFVVKLGEHVYDRHGYFGGMDRDRAADINRMFADESVDGIFCFTGGWGSPRVLPYLDYGMIRRNPKVIIGFSDITALINAIHQKTGLVTFHGPVAASRIEPWTLENFRRVVMSADPPGALQNPPKPDGQLVERDHRIVKIRGGRASGKIVGGNLTLIAATMGTPYEIDTENTLLFLEDVNEEMYRVDRMLSQLWLGGKFEKVKGLIFGRCSRCPVTGPSFSLHELLVERFGDAGVPAISGFAFGHIEKKLTLPIGMTGTLDADAGTVTLDRAAVTGH